MKILKCYVENFGGLSKFSYDFNDGLNVLQHENGWGKTTLAVFIKAMFYGLSSYKGNNLSNNERRKYAPWQGGNFGGNIEFEVQGRQYRIERFFGKTNNADTYYLIDLKTGKPSQDYPLNLGEVLFDLDADGFERTVFIPQKKLENAVSESVLNRLTNLLHGTTQSYNYEAAEKYLDNQRRVLSNQQHSGKIDRLEINLQEKTSRIHELQRQSEQLVHLQQQLNTINNEIKISQNAQAAVNQKIGNHTAISDLQTTTSLTKRNPWKIAIWISMLITLVGGALLVSGLFCGEYLLALVGGILILFGGSVCGICLYFSLHFSKKNSGNTLQSQSIKQSNNCDISELYEEQNMLQKRLDEQFNVKMQLMSELQQIDNAAAKLAQMQAEKNWDAEQLVVLQQDISAINHARAFLKTASENLNTKFLDPMKSGLQKYLQIITQSKFENLNLDTDLRLTLNEFGLRRTVDYYSAGYQNLFELCMRLALIDTLFQNEKPFLVLDDPFVNLDEPKIKQAKQFLQTLSQTYQIVYFTCHNSRC